MDIKLFLKTKILHKWTFWRKISKPHVLKICTTLFLDIK